MMAQSVGPRPIAQHKRARFHVWQDRIRDPSLTALLVLESAAMFFVLPLAARGFPIAQITVDALVLGVVGLVVLLSYRGGAIVVILLGLGGLAASRIFGAAWSPTTMAVVRRCGEMAAWGALIWVVVHAVYAPGRITSQRLQGAAVVYLSIATLFAAAYGLVWALAPGAFANLQGAPGSDQATAQLLYFSLTTLTTTGFGDIVPVDPFARSLANLEAVIGVFYIAITITRLVTLELAGRRR